MIHSPLAVCVMRGVSCSSFIGPGISALEIWRPPTPIIGSTATTSTMTPMPPSHCSSARQMLSDGAIPSSLASSVAPVAVSADIDSK